MKERERFPDLFATLSVPQFIGVSGKRKMADLEQCAGSSEWVSFYFFFFQICVEQEGVIFIEIFRILMKCSEREGLIYFGQLELARAKGCLPLVRNRPNRSAVHKSNTSVHPNRELCLAKLTLLWKG